MTTTATDYLAEWTHHTLLQPSGFTIWWNQLDEALVSWQLDHVQRLLREAKRVSLPADERARIYHGEGRYFSQLGEWAQAIKCMMAAIDLLEETEYVEEGIAIMLDLGMALRIQGNQAGAKAAQEQALLLAQEIERVDLAAEALEQIGLNLEHAGEPDTALGYYQQALTHWQALEDTEQHVHSLNHIGDAQRSLGELTAAQQSLEMALTLVAQLADRTYLQAQIKGNLGGVYHDQGKLDAAEEEWLAALAIFDGLGVYFDKIAVLNNLGSLAVQRQQPALALEYFGRSFTLAEALDDQRGIKTALTNMAIVLRDSGQWDMRNDKPAESD